MSAVTFSVRRRDLAWAIALVTVVSAGWVARSDVADAGGTPSGDGVAVVYVAVGTGFPDSLGVGPGAGLQGAPIIIVPTSPPIPAATAAELVRLDPRSVVIVGGSAVVSDAMESALVDLLPNAVVSRLAGANRYETNAMFSEAVFPIETWVAIPSSAFTPTRPATDDALTNHYVAYNGTSGALSAPVALPHGAEILELRAEVYDAHGSNVVVYVMRELSSVASVSSSGASGFQSLATTNIDSDLKIVDNENYAYTIGVTSADNDDLFIRWVNVRYRIGSP